MQEVKEPRSKGKAGSEPQIFQSTLCAELAVWGMRVLLPRLEQTQSPSLLSLSLSLWSLLSANRRQPARCQSSQSSLGLRFRTRVPVPGPESGLEGGVAESEGWSLVTIAPETELAGRKQKRFLGFPTMGQQALGRQMESLASTEWTP